MTDLLLAIAAVPALPAPAALAATDAVVTQSVFDLLAEHWLLLAHAFATAVMLGVIWTCQLVHYPLFARVGRDAFVGYESEHMTRITWIVAPMMGLELITGGLLVVMPPAGLAAWNLGWAPAVGAALISINWISTFLFQGPTHMALRAKGLEEKRVAFLVSSNWVRTVSWTLRAALVLLMLLAAGSATA